MSLIVRRRAVTGFFLELFLAVGEKCHTTARVVGVVLLEVERPLVWRSGVSAPAFTSQLSAASSDQSGGCPVQAPAQDRWPRGYRWSPMGCCCQPEGTGRTEENPWDICSPLLGHSGSKTQALGVLFLKKLMTLANIVLS